MSYANNYRTSLLTTPFITSTQIIPEIPISTLTEATATPSESPTILPTEIIYEVTATYTPTPVITETATDSITPEITATLLDIMTPTAMAISLPKIVSADFETGYPSELLGAEAWVSVSTEAGLAVQYTDNASLRYEATTLSDSAIKVNVLLLQGDISLTLRKSDLGFYRVIIDSTGIVTLLRNDIPVQTATIVSDTSRFTPVEMKVIGAEISVIVDSTVLFTFADPTLLPSGVIEITATTGSLLRVDDLIISGIVDSIVPILPTLEVTPTAQPTVEVVTPVKINVAPTTALTFSFNETFYGWTLRGWSWNQAAGTLETTGSTDIADYSDVQYQNSTVTTAFQTQGGRVRLYSRISYDALTQAISSYMLELSPSGGVTLFRNGMIVASGDTSPFTGATTVQFSVNGEAITASINGVSALTYSDFSPLPAGYVGVQAPDAVADEGIATADVSFDHFEIVGEPLGHYEISNTGTSLAMGGSGPAVAPPGELAPPGTGYMGDFVWNDFDRDGQQDVGEPGMANVLVELWSGTSRLATGFTDAGGYYSWYVTSGYSYYTVVLPPQGYIFTNPDVGNNLTDSDGQGNGSHQATFMSSGEDDYSWDFGLIQLSQCAADTTLEIALVIDGSGSIGSYDFNQVRNFAVGLVDSFTIGNTSTRFSIIQFSSYYSTIIELPLTGVRNTIVNKIRTMYYQGGSTDITCGINLGQSTLVRGRSVTQVPRAMVVFTDGAHNGGGNPVVEAQLAKNAKTIIYTVGVGGYSLPQLQGIASDPDSTHVFTMDTFSQLVVALQSIATEACNTPVVPYLAPTLVTPALSARTNNTTSTFTWQAVPYASARYGGYYEIQIDDNHTFVSPEVSTTPSGLTFAPIFSLPATTPLDKIYYWRVRAWNELGSGPWSLGRAFTLDITAPAAPNLIAPAANAALTIAKPAFSWSAVASGGTTRYQIQVDDSVSFGSPRLDQGVATTSFVPTIPIHQGGNYWRVRAIDQAGNIGPWSLERGMTVNSATAPLNGFFLITTTTGVPTFTWTSLAGATDIRIQVSTSDTFGSLLRDVSATTTSTISLPFNGVNSLPWGIYHWRLAVNSGNGLETSPYSRSLIVTPPTPAVPILTTVTGLFTNDTTPPLDWTAVPYPYAGVDITYRLEVDNNNTFASPEYVVETANISSTVTPALADGLYYWRVKAINEYTLSSAFSVARTFTVDTILPVAPVLNTPATGAITAVRPTFA